ncbi:MAG: tetratricopeptide repeat protein [Acidobacteriia bacterium]|nr:tetratricopeptide repeat protein [Terriglobia bacterium]
MRTVAACLVIAALSMTPALAEGSAVAPPAAGDSRAAAIALYDRGRYPEAHAALTALDVAEKADGGLLYRLAFCAGVAGDQEEHARILARAVAALEQETKAGGPIESWFYLSNAYQNLGRPADSAKVAADATSRLEAGTWKEPEGGVDVFRLAKLYADQGREDRAEERYRKAVEALTPEAVRYPAYLRWARGYLGDLALRRANWEEAASQFAAVVALPAPMAGEWHKLAVARARMGRWQEAADAWHQAEQLTPGGGDDARYSRQLALQAAQLGSLPALTPDGRTWDKPSTEDLENMMLEQAKVALAPPPAAPDVSATPVVTPPENPARLKEAHRIFVAAGIEYAARGLPIRETAFSKGFAPLVFHPEQWEPKTTEK